MRFNLNNLVGTLMKDVTTTKGATLVSVEDFHKNIVKGEYLTIVSKILAAKADGTMKKVVVKGNEQMVSLAEHLKKQLPYYVPQADVRKRRLWEHATDFTGLAPIDCDHLTKEQVDSLMAWGKEQPWIVEGHRSCRGEGVHLIVAMGVVKCDTKEEYTSEYKRRYAIISRYIEQQTGIEVDWQCTDVLRGIFVSYDPEAFLRPVSEVKCFDYPEEALPGDTPEEVRKHSWHGQEAQVSTSGGTSETAKSTKKDDIVMGGPPCQPVNKHLLSSFLSYHIYKPSVRHSWWIKLGQRLRYNGIERDTLPLYREAMRGLLLYNNLIQGDDPLLRSATEVDEAMAWGYDHSDKPEKDNGTKRKRGRPKKEKGEKDDKKVVVMEQIHETLDSMARFRFNVITEQVEVLQFDGNGEWEELNDTLFWTFYDRLKRSGIRTNQSDVNAAIYSKDYTPQYSPHREYLDSCPVWDESQPNYIRQIFEHLIFESEKEKAYALPLLEKWFVCEVALWLGKVDDNQVMPVLKGEQNVGKSHFYRHLLPPELRKYYKEIQPGDKLDKDQKIAMSHYLLIGFEEFTLTEKNSSNQIKAFISAAASNERAAYGRFAQTRKRRASLIASCNDDMFITDKNGSRRYLTITIVGTKKIGYNTMPYREAYGQALWTINHSEPDEYRPTKKEADIITKHNEKYMQRSICEVMIERLYRKPKDYEQGKMVGTGDIIEKLILHRVPNATPAVVGKTMKELGFYTKHTNKGTRYYVKEMDEPIIEQEATDLGAEQFRLITEENDRRRSEGEDIPF